jgi:hypothetical protein
MKVKKKKKNNKAKEQIRKRWSLFQNRKKNNQTRGK